MGSHVSYLEGCTAPQSSKHQLHAAVVELVALTIGQEDAIGAIVGGFCKDVLAVLPLEFAAEARKLLTLKLENSVG